MIRWRRRPHCKRPVRESGEERGGTDRAEGRSSRAQTCVVRLRRDRSYRGGFRLASARRGLATRRNMPSAPPREFHAGRLKLGILAVPFFSCRLARDAGQTTTKGAGHRRDCRRPTSATSGQAEGMAAVTPVRILCAPFIGAAVSQQRRAKAGWMRRRHEGLRVDWRPRWGRQLDCWRPAFQGSDALRTGLAKDARTGLRASGGRDRAIANCDVHPLRPSAKAVAVPAHRDDGTDSRLWPLIMKPTRALCSRSINPAVGQGHLEPCRNSLGDLRLAEIKPSKPCQPREVDEPSLGDLSTLDAKVFNAC